MTELVAKVRTDAQQINASNSTYNIFALIRALEVTKQAGFNTAIDSLSASIRQANTGKAPISFSSAEAVVRLIASEFERIGPQIGLTAEQVRQKVNGLWVDVLELWKVAPSKPGIFAPFSFGLSNEPSRAVVHNWAFASIQMARSLNQLGKLAEAFKAARDVPSLAPGINLAIATTSASFADAQLLLLADFETEDSAQFYAALGSRLSVLVGMDEPQASAMLMSMIVQAAKHGPNPLDVGLFVALLNETKRATSND